MNTSNMIEISTADADDIAGIVTLLKKTNLPVEDIPSPVQQFIVAKKMGYLIGSAGIEVYGNSCVLRSFAVQPEHQNQGTGGLIYSAILDLARKTNLKDLYLLTTTAENYFAGKGWTIINRNEAPSEVQKSSEFSTICPSTAVCMKLSL